MATDLFAVWRYDVMIMITMVSTASAWHCEANLTANPSGFISTSAARRYSNEIHLSGMRA